MLEEAFFISGRVDQDTFFCHFIVDQVAEYLHETDRDLLYLHPFLQIGKFWQNHYNQAKMNQLHQKVKWADAAGRTKTRSRKQEARIHAPRSSLLPKMVFRLPAKNRFAQLI